MIDIIIKNASCQIACGGELGTGHLIANNRVLTARHCVGRKIEANERVEITFLTASGDMTLEGQIVRDSEEFDIAVLSFAEELNIAPIPMKGELAREGVEWRSFGYPLSKRNIGHRIAGAVAQVLDAPRARMDMDLSIDPATTLQDYSGLSGAPVVSNRALVAIMRLKLDGTLGAISIHCITSFLAEAGIEVKNLNNSQDDRRETPLASREAFQREFETLVLSKPGQYFFIEGAHGIGKTTFSRRFVPLEKSLQSLGAYSLLVPNDPLTPVFRAQPDIFFDWLNTSIASLITDRRPRTEQKMYSAMITDTAQMLTAWSDYCLSTQRTGILFLDGLNEVGTSTTGQLDRLLGLLPATLPPHVVIVFTAPNHSNAAVHLSGRVSSENAVRLPPMEDAACVEYCQQELNEAKATPMLIRRICDKALGHPLYLRYLIEYANSNPTDDALDEFPILTGSIEQYYDLIWTRLLTDSNAIHLIAIITRLRTSIRFEDLGRALNDGEQASLISTLGRIRHLLSHPDMTGIYHPSFAAFAIEKTKEVDAAMHKRLADFCRLAGEKDYCAENLLYHLLRGGTETRAIASAACTQEWFDKCVVLGVQPDTLLNDIDEALVSSIDNGQAVEAIRLLLLSQRARFRIDTLFAQSATLMACALIAVDRPQDALKYLIRYDTLIVGPEEALEVAFALIQRHHDDEALELLSLLHDRISEAHAGKINLSTYTRLCELRIRIRFMARLAGADSGMEQIQGIVERFANACKETITNDRPLLNRLVGQIAGLSSSYFLTFRDTYPKLSALREMYGADFPPQYLVQLSQSFLDFVQEVENYNLSKKRKSLTNLFDDVKQLRTAGGNVSAGVERYWIDALIRFDAPSDVVLAFADLHASAPISPVPIKASNGVDVDFEKIFECSQSWRYSAFIDNETQAPSIPAFDSSGWLSSASGLISALFWCEGRARRAKVDGEMELLAACQSFLWEQLLPAFSFSLAQRVKWKEGYAIPENLFPMLYRHVTELIIDCFPEQMPDFLRDVLARSTDQLGLYSEGFRRALHAVIKEVLREEVSPLILPLVLSLLRKWRDHVLNGVENRHELVPELLRLIPLFTKLGAKEEAARLYEHLMSVSMGPTWYKEDQFDLMTTVLAQLPVGDDLGGQVPEIAACFERASGELTFQRFIRYEKAELIGELFRHRMHRASWRYFARQSCGSLVELLAEAESGTIDKPYPRSGMRFPGGALDEQAAILQLLKNAKSADWRLRWALLEVFHLGDERHINDFAGEYANIINEAGNAPEAAGVMLHRLERMFNAETSPELKPKFSSGFTSRLQSEHHGTFGKFMVTPPTPAPVPEPGGQAIPTRPEPSSINDPNDEFFFPGTFGKQSALRRTRELFGEADSQVSLGNVNAAKKKVVEALTVAQEGGWNIWGSFTNDARQAKEVLQSDSTDAGEILRHYMSLILAERYQPRWLIANYLICRVTTLLNAESRQVLLREVIKHSQLMVGPTRKEAESYSFLVNPSQGSNPTEELFLFLLWLTDHPKSLRRNNAALALAWIVQEMIPLMPKVAEIAFGMSQGFGADVLCGILDGLSIQNPERVWAQLEPHLVIDRIAEHCGHLSRLATLRAIAARAAEVGSSSGREVLGRINNIFEGALTHTSQSSESAELPNWASCLESEWNALQSILPDAATVKTKWENELARSCAPISVNDAKELERLVCESFREHPFVILNRWDSKVRYALNLAIFAHVTKSSLESVMNCLRISNPSLPELTLVLGFESPGQRAIASILAGDFSHVIGDAESVFLNYVETVERPGRFGKERLCLIDVVAVIVPARSRRRGITLPQLQAVFTSKELPIASKAAPHETCCGLRLEPAFFGRMTPATPLPAFEKLSGASKDAFSRINWRSGRRHENRRFGQPVSEGCLLSIKRGSLKLKESEKLAWIVRLNGEEVMMIDAQNNQLY